MLTLIFIRKRSR